MVLTLDGNAGYDDVQCNMQFYMFKTADANL